MFDTLGWFRAGRLALTVVALLAVSMARTGVRETTGTVGRRARISITNCCGPITVKPSGSRLVVAKTLSHSEEVNFVNEQRGDRVKLRSESNRQGDNLAEYTVLVPADAILTLRSANGMIDVEGLRGDVIVEAMTASVHIDNISECRLSRPDLLLLWGMVQKAFPGGASAFPLTFLGLGVGNARTAPVLDCWHSGVLG